MEQEAPRTVHRSDYGPPDYLIDEVELRFDLGEEESTVRAMLSVRRNPARPDASPDLVLDGEALELRALSLDGRRLEEGEYQVDDRSLRIPLVPSRFTVVTEVAVHPERNTNLEGLYRSRAMFCTQCEAEGFRRITYFLDRPDVLARFTTTIVADAERYPVLLSNGNPDGRGNIGDGRLWARWRDPFPKPCYLFALVAGRLSVLEDSFVTRSGRRIPLRIYVEAQNVRIEHFLGDPNWRQEWESARGGNQSFGVFLADHFGRQMQKLGYIHRGVGQMPLIRSARKNLPLYRLALFSRNELGAKFWTEAQKYADPQIGLL